ncbi:transposase [Paenibacillus yanchengensis]|uniref:Transposase n=1 Tax=Paenibacillus yanchengensis TaxID=2035833 RepID=A0ABW4YH09_9BACL
MNQKNEDLILSILFRVPYIRDRFHLYEYPLKEELLAQWRHFSQQFPDDNACYTYLYYQKWPDGFRCPKCNYANYTEILTRRMPIYQCHCCNHQTTLTANTIMEQTRLSLRKWLMAFFFLSLDQIGVNAYQLHLLLQVNYKTAWALHRKIRQAISCAISFNLLGKPDDHNLKRNSLEEVQNTESYQSVTPLHTCGIMFERAPQHMPVMIGFEMNRPNFQSYKSTHSDSNTPTYVFTRNHISVLDNANDNRKPILDHTYNLNHRPIHTRTYNPTASFAHANTYNTSTYTQTLSIISNLTSSTDPIVTGIKLKLIPPAHMVGGANVSSPYVQAFKQMHFENYFPKDNIIHAPRMKYRQKRAVQKAFDYMMRRFNQTYGTIKNKYLQFYFDEMSFYYNATIHKASIFHQLSKLSMIYKTRTTQHSHFSKLIK